MLQKIKRWVLMLIRFLLNPHFLICYGLGWLVTNGWSYILFIIGITFDIAWITAIATAYLAFLWLPVSPEKIVTVAIAIYLLRRLFPDDKDTLGILRDLSKKIRKKLNGERMTEDE